ncbi:hypothetical protein [Cronobacter dublinensis]|uniref:hypothetical protein n=1 Tax=Cronobacter dublinensis TaxID=413497 RepID=UPI000CFDD3B9|nr:hypothetical protein [Cronobacter dublinensis]
MFLIFDPAIARSADGTTKKTFSIACLRRFCPDVCRKMFLRRRDPQVSDNPHNGLVIASIKS